MEIKIIAFVIMMLALVYESYFFIKGWRIRDFLRYAPHILVAAVIILIANVVILVT